MTAAGRNRWWTADPKASNRPSSSVSTVTIPVSGAGVSAVNWTISTNGSVMPATVIEPIHGAGRKRSGPRKVNGYHWLSRKMVEPMRPLVGNRPRYVDSRRMRIGPDQ